MTKKSRNGKARANHRPHARDSRRVSLAARSLPRRLLRWYDANRRDLPWRRRADDPYAQLLAEFMLQQTQVGTVLNYYDRFIERFPTVAALAVARLDDVLTLWSGLGYYSRARNLHATARKIVAEHGGVVPKTVENLMALPGIGRYTAGAIASIAHGIRAPVLDGNVVRVLMRLLALKADPKLPAVKAKLWSHAESLLPNRRCGDFNQALMELGATLCAPRSPNCKDCPLHSSCRAHQQNLTDRIPPTARPARVRPAQMAVAAIHTKNGRSPIDEWLFVQRPPSGLWAGLWELPTEPLASGESIAAARKRLESSLPVRCRLSTKPVATVLRQLTHRRITFHVFSGTTRNHDGQSPPHPRPWKWVKPEEIRHLGISRACEAILAALDAE